MSYVINVIHHFLLLLNSRYKIKFTYIFNEICIFNKNQLQIFAYVFFLLL